MRKILTRNVYYFGADFSWEKLQLIGFRRRNTCLLKALVESPHIGNVYVVQKSSRWFFVCNILKTLRNKNKVKDIYFASLLPEVLMDRLGLQIINVKINSLFIKLMTSYSNTNNLIWVYWPKAYKNVKHSGLRGILIFDTDHNIIDDPNLSLSRKQERDEELIDIGKHSSYILSGSRSMNDWFNKRGFQNTIHLRNGIFESRFNNKKYIRQNERFTIGYCGTLSRWIDYDLFKKLASLHPEWQFVIIGKPYKCNDWIKLKECGNVEFLGEQGPEEVARILPTFDVAIALYKAHIGIDGDSMKIYEYLACGLPVVSTRFNDYLTLDFEEILFIGNNILEIEQHLYTINSGLFNIETYTDKVRKFILKSSWNQRVDELFSKI